MTLTRAVPCSLPSSKTAALPMVAPQMPADEAQRLAALQRLALLDTPATESFDRITRLAAKALGVPMLLVSLVDADRQWFKSCVGLDATQTSRDVSFCGHVVFERRTLVVPDAARDPRFAGNPLVTGPPYVRAYLERRRLGASGGNHERRPVGGGMKKINVLIVDDSAVVRQVLSEQLAADPSISVMGAVSDPIFAMARMKLQWPDVIVLDVEMPRMDGVNFLRKIMEERPTPVVICSTLTEKGAATTLDALAAGAVCIVTKPKLGLKRFMEDASADLIAAVKAAGHVNVARLKPSTARGESVHKAAAPKLTADVVAGPPGGGAMTKTTERIVAIGTSTGGTQALERVLTGLPRGCPGIVVVQHMPEQFTAAFAARLDGLCQVNVTEAVNGERLLPGHVIIAPGGKHLMLRRSGAYY